MKKKLNLCLFLLIPVLVTVIGGCGYKLSGFGNQIPDHVRTVIIPEFDNQTTRIEVEEFVTYTVKEEFIRRSNLQVVNAQADADALLEGKIMSFMVTPESISADGSANLYRLRIVLRVRFIDLTSDEIIYEGNNISYTDTYDIDSIGADGEIDIDTDDFFSQETEKLQQISEDFAESVVTTILENF